MDKYAQLDEVIRLLRELYNIQGSPRFNTPQYREFHDKLTDFIYANHFEDSDDWTTISNNLIYSSTQFMVSSEADKILICLENIKRKMLSSKYEHFWEYIHPEIEAVTKQRFESEMYADAVEAAFKEINVRVKGIVKTRTGEELDGASLMKKAFSVNTPIIKLGDIAEATGKNVQQGYMEIYSGAMTGIRNPKAHNNQTITKEDAIRKLNFASILMYKIDNEIVIETAT